METSFRDLDSRLSYLVLRDTRWRRREIPVCRNCVTSPFAYAQLSHMPVTGSTMKQAGHTLGGSSSLARAFLTLVCG